MLFGIKEPEPDYEAIWNEYSAIDQRMQQDYEDELAAARADLGGRGIQEGSEAWEAAIQTIEDKRQTRVQELQGTEAFQILSDAYRANVAMATAPMRLAEYGDDSQQQGFNPYADRVFGAGAGREMERLIQPGQRFDMNQWNRQAVDMGTFYENQYGKPEMAEPAAEGESVESAAASAAQTRARRAASGGFSPWW